MEDKFKEYNKQGLIPGPKETEENYLKRSEFCLAELNHLIARFAPKDFKEYDCELKSSWLKQAADLNRPYAIAPLWVPLFFSNWKMMPWQGASTWIFQLEENMPTGAMIQLRKSLYKRESLLGLYSKEELIAHELCHVARMEFEEPKYEEFLAYRTSKRVFSRYFGPLVQSVSESRWFMILLLMILILEVFYLYQGAYHLMFNPWIYSLPLVLLSTSAIRLFFRHRTLEKTAKKVGEEILFRLTDSEIEKIAKLSKEEVANFMNEQTSFRWQFIRECY